MSSRQDSCTCGEEPCSLCSLIGTLLAEKPQIELARQAEQVEQVIELWYLMRLLSVPVHASLLALFRADPTRCAECITTCLARSGFGIEQYGALSCDLIDNLEATPLVDDPTVNPATAKLCVGWDVMRKQAMDAANQVSVGLLAMKCTSLL